MKMNHLTFDDLMAYIARTLDDAQRESIDAHLSHCPACRASLAEQELRQRQISNELRAVLNAADLPQQMSFAAIAPRLQTRKPRANFWPRLGTSAPLVFSLLGLILTVLGFWQMYAVKAVVAPAHKIGVYPTLACFFFMLASVEQFDQSLVVRPRFRITAIVAGLLWLGSAFIGLLNLIVIRDLAIMAAVAMGWGVKGATPLAMIAVYLGAIFYIGLIIGGGEYHYRNFGQPGSWKLFSITIVGQLFILILPYLIL
ncbi:MAG TPA: hypothetical protein DEH22_08085 [Chloroflexi bacterium]|nr:hypothetical protein [Chloroflexota bacterium]